MEPKPGVKTTEFWVVILVTVIMLASGLTIREGVLSFQLDIDLVQWWIIGAGGGYPVSRGLAKLGGKTNA